MNLLNKYIHRILLMLPGLVPFVACDEDSSLVPQVPSSALLTVLESDIEVFEDENKSLSVTFIEPAKADGTITVTFDGEASYGSEFTTEPEGSSEGISIPVKAGDKEVSVMIKPVARIGTVEASSQVKMIFSASGGVSFGTKNFTNITFLNKPVITVTGDVQVFENTMELESSSSQSVNVSALGLTGELTVTASANFEVSVNDVDFEASISFNPEDINDNDTTVFIRFSPAFDALGSIVGNITFASENANDVAVSVAGTGTEQPATFIIEPEEIDFGAAPNGSVSPPVEILVDGYRFTEDVQVVVTGPFEISEDSITFSSTVSLDFNAINDSTITRLYARFAPTSGVDGEKTGDITFSSAGATSFQISCSGTEGLSLIAYTSFEEPVGLDVDYVDTGDSTVSRVLQNNDGEAPVQYNSMGGELGFSTVYQATGGVGATDGDDLGVTNKTSIVGDTPEGGYTDGVQGYVVDDTDGIIKIVFDEVDVSALSTLRISMDYLFNDTSWEVDDVLTITMETGEGLNQTLLELNGLDIENNALDPEPHIWNTLDLDVSSLSGSTVQLSISIQTDAGAEEIYFDNIKILGN